MSPTVVIFQPLKVINGSNRFYPPPRVIQVTPIYDTPLSDNGRTYEHPGPNQPSSARDQRDSSYYPEDHHSRPYYPDRSRRRPPSDYDDSSDDRHPRHNNYYSDDYDRSPDYDRRRPDSDRSSLDDDRASPPPHHQSSSQPNRSAHREASSSHPNRSTHSSLDDDYSAPQHHQQSSSQPERPTHIANAVSKLQRYLEHNRQAAHRDPFGYLKSFPDEVQRVLKTIPPSPQFCWSECTGQRKAVCVSTSFFQRPNTIFSSLFLYRLELIIPVQRTN